MFGSWLAADACSNEASVAACSGCLDDLPGFSGDFECLRAI